MFSTKFVTDCVQKGILLDMEPYRLVMGSDAHSDGDGVVSDFDDEQMVVNISPKQYKGRVKYRLAEDMRIIRYILEEKLYRETNGNAMWKTMEMLEIVKHPWQSIRDRFRKIIQPNIKSYHLKYAEISLLTNPYLTDESDVPRRSPRKASATSSLNNNESENVTKTPEIDNFDEMLLQRILSDYIESSPTRNKNKSLLQPKATGISTTSTVTDVALVTAENGVQSAAMAERIVVPTMEQWAEESPELKAVEKAEAATDVTQDTVTTDERQLESAAEGRTTPSASPVVGPNGLEPMVDNKTELMTGQLAMSSPDESKETSEDDRTEAAEYESTGPSLNKMTKSTAKQKAESTLGQIAESTSGRIDGSTSGQTEKPPSYQMAELTSEQIVKPIVDQLTTLTTDQIGNSDQWKMPNVCEERRKRKGGGKAVVKSSGNKPPKHDDANLLGVLTVYNSVPQKEQLVQAGPKRRRKLYKTSSPKTDEESEPSPSIIKLDVEDNTLRELINDHDNASPQMEGVQIVPQPAVKGYKKGVDALKNFVLAPEDSQPQTQYLVPSSDSDEVPDNVQSNDKYVKKVCEWLGLDVEELLYVLWRMSGNMNDTVNWILDGGSDNEIPIWRPEDDLDLYSDERAEHRLVIRFGAERISNRLEFLQSNS